MDFWDGSHRKADACACIVFAAQTLELGKTCVCFAADTNKR
jgi:hypothetical protein